MLQKILTYLKEGHSHTGLEILEEEGREFYLLLRVVNKKGNLLIENSQRFESLETMSKEIDRKAPVFVCINTAAVLTKRLETSGESSPASLVNQAFPNLDHTDFYYQILEQESISMVSIARKQTLDSLLKKLQEKGIRPFSIALGLSTLGSIIPYLKESHVQTAKWQLEIHNGQLHGCSQETIDDTKVYDVNGLSLFSNDILSFSHILMYLGRTVPSNNFTGLLQSLGNQYQNQRLFQTGIRFALGFFIVLLLGNFLIYQHYFGKVEELNSSLEANGSRKGALQELTLSVESKRERVEMLQKSSSSNATAYLDALAISLPNSILLEGMTYRPLEKTVQKDKPILLEDSSLVVSGISKDSEEFSQWLEKLEEQEWIANVETLDFDYASSDASQFTLKINIDGLR
jgi:Tfp pilus assembly protein PilN